KPVTALPGRNLRRPAFANCPALPPRAARRIGCSVRLVGLTRPPGQELDDLGYIVASQIHTQQFPVRRSYSECAVGPGPIDDQEVIVITANQQSSGAAA